jgi:hypothetical protein
VHVLCDLVAEGCSVKRAAAELNLGVGRVQSWVHQGRVGHQPYAEFVQWLADAELEHEQNLREAIEAARERLRRLSA